MVDSKCSVVLGDQRALAGGADEPVVPDPGREGQKSLTDPGHERGIGPAPVPFEAELALEGPEDGLDPLPDPAQGAEAPGLVTAIGPDQGRLLAIDEGLELTAGIALVGHDEHARL